MLLSAFFYWLIICRCFSLLLYDLVFFFHMLVLWWWVSIFSDVVGKLVSVAGEWAWHIGSVYCLKWYCLWVASWQIVLVSEFLVLAGCSIGGFWDYLMFFSVIAMLLAVREFFHFFIPVMFCWKGVLFCWKNEFGSGFVLQHDKWSLLLSFNPTVWSSFLLILLGSCFFWLKKELLS